MSDVEHTITAIKTSLYLLCSYKQGRATDYWSLPFSMEKGALPSRSSKVKSGIRRDNTRQTAANEGAIVRRFGRGGRAIRPVEGGATYPTRRTSPRSADENLYTHRPSLCTGFKMGRGIARTVPAQRVASAKAGILHTTSGKANKKVEPLT